MKKSFSTLVQYVYRQLRSINIYSNDIPYAKTWLFIVFLMETVYTKKGKLAGLILHMTSLSTGNFTLGWYRYYHVNSINQGKKKTGISGFNLLKTLISSGNRILVRYRYRYFQVRTLTLHLLTATRRVRSGWRTLCGLLSSCPEPRLTAIEAPAGAPPTPVPQARPTRTPQSMATTYLQ